MIEVRVRQDEVIDLLALGRLVGARLDAQLADANFVERAPAEKVTELRERSNELDKQIETQNNNVEALN